MTDYKLIKEEKEKEGFKSDVKGGEGGRCPRTQRWAGSTAAWLLIGSVTYFTLISGTRSKTAVWQQSIRMGFYSDAVLSAPPRTMAIVL